MERDKRDRFWRDGRWHCSMCLNVWGHLPGFETQTSTTNLLAILVVRDGEMPASSARWVRDGSSSLIWSGISVVLVDSEDQDGGDQQPTNIMVGKWSADELVRAVKFACRSYNVDPPSQNAIIRVAGLPE
jgi:hypothetical protein